MEWGCIEYREHNKHAGFMLSGQASKRRWGCWCMEMLPLPAWAWWLRLCSWPTSLVCTVQHLACIALIAYVSNAHMQGYTRVTPARSMYMQIDDMCLLHAVTAVRALASRAKFKARMHVYSSQPVCMQASPQAAHCT